VTHNLESQKLQYAMEERLHQLGWCDIEVVDEDLGRSAAGVVTRAGFERMVAEVCLGKVGAVAAREVSRFARNSREWQQLVEVCRVVDTVLIDQEMVYAPRLSNDRLLLGRDVQYGSALAFAYAGDDGRAQALADDLGRRSSEATLVQFNYLPTLHAKLAVGRGNASDALESLRTAAPYELGQTTSSIYGWTGLYPVYVRGEAFLSAHQGNEASAEFQKILDHRGVVLNEPIGVLAHLQLGRAYVLQGDRAKARAAYQDFLTLWKDADPDIPVLIAAKSEYAKLK
jgi:predicted Zn-dependent protease